MTALTADPCSTWVPIGCKPLPIGSSAITGSMLSAAQSILWAKSGRQFDECTLTVRPCRRDCYGTLWPWDTTWNQWGSAWPYPYMFNGQWFNMGCGGCPGSCSCTSLQEVLLPFPVSTVSALKIDGVPLSPSAVAMLYDYRRLIRIDGGLWPICNDLSKDDTHVGTWSITFKTGTPVPPLGQVALGELFMELVNACTGAACKLPAPIQQIVRQGVTMNMLDPNVVFADGKIGLRMCDLFISTYNPGGISARATLYDPDGRRPVQATWPP